MATYLQKYGTGAGILDTGNGIYDPVGPTLGDPSRFSFKFRDGGALWIGVQDKQKRPWFIMVAGPDGAPIYDWAAFSKGTVGQPEAEELFSAIEAENMRLAGLDYNPSKMILPGMVLLQEGGPGRLDIWDHSPHVYDSSDPIYSDKGKATPELASHIHRASLDVYFPKKGGGETLVTCTVNPWLRIGYIAARTGTRTGGDPVAEIVLTVAEIIVAIVGIWTGNVGLVVQAISTIVTTWYNWSVADAKAAEEASGWGKVLAENGQSIGVGGPISPGGMVMLTPGAAMALRDSGILKKYPTAADLAKKEHQQSVGGLVLLGVAAKLLFF